MIDLCKPPLPSPNLLKKLLPWSLLSPLGPQHKLVIIFRYLMRKCWVLDACDLFPLNEYCTVTSKSRGFFLFCETLSVPVKASPSLIVITSSRYITVCFQCVGLDLGPVCKEQWSQHSNYARDILETQLIVLAYKFST